MLLCGCAAALISLLLLLPPLLFATNAVCSARGLGAHGQPFGMKGAADGGWWLCCDEGACDHDEMVYEILGEGVWVGQRGGGGARHGLCRRDARAP